MTIARETYARNASRFRQEFLDALQRPAETQQLVLDDSVTPNVETAFGRAHDFAHVKTIDDFRRAVPIRDYDAYSPWLERAAAGEAAVLTAEEPAVFLRTSGTTGACKKIPRTRHYQSKYHIPFFLAFEANVIEHYPETIEAPFRALRLMGGRKQVSSWTAGGAPLISASELRPELFWSAQPASRWSAPWALDVPDELISYEERTYFRLRAAVEADLRALISINPSTILMLADSLAASLPRLVDELRTGSVCGVATRPPNPERAAELAALADRHGAITPRHVWPNLRVVCCWTSASAALYLPRIRELFGDVDIRPTPTIASEALMALPIDSDPIGSPLAIPSGVFEFVPVTEEIHEGTRTLLFDQLDDGKDYQLVLTQASGLYRYAIGDVFRVVRHHGSVPRIEFVGKVGATSSFTGEKLTEWQLQKTTDAALAACGLAAKGFVWVPAWGQPPAYVAVLELEHQPSVEVRARLERELDVQLGEHNDEYSGKRESGRLGSVRLKLVPPGTFSRRWLDATRQSATPDQFKSRILLGRDDAFLSVADEAS